MRRFCNSEDNTMPTILIALASALLLAALVTEATSRFWPGSYIALLIITGIALFINGLFNTRLAQRAALNNVANQPQRERKPAQDRTRNSEPKKNRPARNSNRQNTNQADRNTDRNADRNTNRNSDRNSDRNTDRNTERAPRPQETETGPRGPEESGEVKWFNRSKGYGFIIRDNGDEVFVHQRSIVASGGGDQRQRPVLRDGQKVSFVVAHLDKGAQAEQVKPLD